MKYRWTKEAHKTLSAIPGTVWGLGFVTLCMNASTIIIFSLSPTYLTSVLGMNLLALGLLEAVVEFMSWLTRIVSGVLSDSMHKRKPILMVAYLLAAITRLVFPLVPSVGWVVGARLTERVSNGLQASPREALVGDVAPSNIKGTCYGLRQTLGLMGSFAGALALMYLMRRYGHDYTLAFWIAAVPAFLGVGVLFFGVHDHAERIERLKPTALSNAVPLKPSFSWATIRTICHDILKLKRSYWYVVIISFLFSLGNFSGTFMILQAKRAGLTIAELPMVMIIQNLMAFLAAFPIGWISDRIGRDRLLAIGFVLVIIADLFLALGSSTLVLLGVAFWGLQMGISQSMLVVKVADTVPADLRGTSFGIYYFASAVALFITNSSAGWLSHHLSAESVFYMSALCAGLALLSLTFLRAERRQNIVN